MFDRIRLLIDRLHEVQEVASLTDRDLADLGMSRDQIMAFLRMPRDIGDRVTAMGAIFGLGEGDLKRDHALWVALLDTCGHCSDRAACARLLGSAGPAGPEAAGFCANTGSFRDLAARLT